MRHIIWFGWGEELERNEWTGDWFHRFCILRRRFSGVAHGVPVYCTVYTILPQTLAMRKGRAGEPWVTCVVCLLVVGYPYFTVLSKTFSRHEELYRLDVATYCYCCSQRSRIALLPWLEPTSTNSTGQSSTREKLDFFQKSLRQRTSSDVGRVEIRFHKWCHKRQEVGGAVDVSWSEDGQNLERRWAEGQYKSCA